MKFNKTIIPKILIAFFVLISFATFLGVKAWLDTDPSEIIPPDSFIKEGQVITIIEEDSKYFYKIENFNKEGAYTTPCMETQITYDEYAQIRSNGTYDILEKRNRHIINDVYVDEYYRAYSDGEVMAGNYVAEVLDGYFVPVEINPFKEKQTVLIDDGGIYYIATYHFDKNYNYTKAASYILLSENQYNAYIINEQFDYIKEIEWEISYDGNTITKTITYSDVNNNLLARPIILQLTGFEDLDGWVDSDDIEDSSSSSEESSSSSSESSSSSSSDNIEDIISSAISSAISSVVDKIENENKEDWLGSDGGFSDGTGLFPWEGTWSDNPPTTGSEGDWTDKEEGFINVGGFYDDSGNFISVDKDGNILPSESGEFDEDGNFKPSGEDGYFDPDGIHHPEDEDTGEFDEDGNFNDGDNKFDEDGNIIDGNEPGDDNGYYDSDGNFIQEDGTILDEDGNIHKEALKDLLLDENGRKYVNPYGYLTLNESGEIVLFGYKGYYDKNGLYHSEDGKVGFFDKNSVFVETREKGFEDGFYDEIGDWHSFNEIYTTENGTLQLVTYPKIAISTDGLTISVGGSPYKYSSTGLVTKDSHKGYFNSDGDFIKSDKSAYKGGFYDSLGRWIDDSLYNVSNTNEISLSYGYFDCYGVFSTPNRDRGYFNSNGIFVINKENVYNEGYYYFDKDFQSFGEIYIDDAGNVHSTGSDEVITADGQIANIQSQKGILDKNGYYFNAGNVITSDGKIGHYNEFKAFCNGQIPYLYGYYDANGNFFRYDGIVINVDGEIGYFNELGNWITGVEDASLDKNGNYIMVDGTVITPDGQIGYYDEKGVFHEGENPYGDEWYDATGNVHKGTEIGYVDSNDNTILPNGVVISSDGKVGYYDENGNFIEGKSPYENGYYDENGIWHSNSELGDSGKFDSNGNLIMENGIVITEDGKVGYYDKDGNFIEGNIPFEGGYYNEKGEFITDGYYDKDGNYIMSDGTIVSPDGTVILPDGTIVSGYIDENGNLITDTPLGDSYYDASGNKINGVNPDKNGYYDKDGNYYLKGDKGYYDVNGTYHTSDGEIGYYDENGNFIDGQTNPYLNGFYDKHGNWHGDSDLKETEGYYDANGIFHEGENPYSNGYYDKDGNWHSLSSLGTVDENGNTVLPNGTVLTEDGRIGYYDENGIWHEGELPYEDGYYDKDGNWHSYEDEGISVDEKGNIILPDGTIMDNNGNVLGVLGEVSYDSSSPMIGYYDENGVFVVGEENPYEGGYYDKDGNWHSTTTDENVWFDANGNAHLSTDSIGYYDSDGNFHLKGDEGYYDVNGTYHSKDGEIGYYDKDGNFVAGEENPYESGYYDKDGNWHPAGETGYYDKDGNWHEDVSNSKVGYYDENGVWHEGQNPYTNGFYDEKGIWHGEGLPETSYFDAEGNLVSGTNKNELGWYDSKGNWHPNGADGYFTAGGTYHKKDGTKGYYDIDGIWHEGTNPYLKGYYDEEGNWHPFGDNGYYDANGTYHTSDGKIGYYDANGVWHEGQENPYKDGWYDEEGNFRPYGSVGYYDADGVWHEGILQSSKYAYGSKDYVLFTGLWRSSAENAMLKLAGNTVQFTINKDSINSVYIDTGIYVALHSILEFEEAKDILHSIAISTNNTFVQDNDSAMIIYNGRVLSIRKDSIITVKALSDLFENTNIDITVDKSRIGKKYALVEAIESGVSIKLKFNDLVVIPESPLVVVKNEAYVSLKDVEDIIFYDYSMKPNGEYRSITFSLKKNIPYESLRKYYAEKVVMVTESKTINYIYGNGYVKVEELKDIKPMVLTDKDGKTVTYIPLKVIPRLTGCDASYDTSTQTIDLDYKDGIAFMETFYDYSGDSDGTSFITESVNEKDKIN